MSTRGQEIWARALWVAIDSAEEGGLDAAALFRDLPFDAKSARKLKRVAWNDYVTFVDRMEVATGGPDALARLTEKTFPEVVPEVQAIAATLLAPKTLLKLHWTVICPLLFPAVDFVFVDRGADVVHLEAWLPAGFRPSRAVHHATLGAIRAHPSILGLPPAVVTGETLDDHVSWDVQLPPSRTLFARMKQRLAPGPVKVVLGYDDAGVPVGMSWGAPAETPSRLESSAQRWGLTPRQTEVLELVVAGKSNKEIASQLGTAINTAELHVTNLLRRSGTQSRAELISNYWSTTSN